jgi:hypothetical protein
VSVDADICETTRLKKFRTDSDDGFELLGSLVGL